MKPTNLPNRVDNQYQEKTCCIKDIKVDNAARLVEGYFSDFDTIDSDRDKIVKGAFARSIEEHGPQSTGNRKIAHLAFHDLTRMIGDIRKLEETDQGLFFASFLGRDTEGQNALMRYEDNIIKEHSIGFNYLESGLDKIEGNEDKDEQGYWRVSDLKLWEGSYVTFGSNENTPNLSAIKSQADLNRVRDQLKERSLDFEKALRNRSYCKEFDYMHEFAFKKLIHDYDALLNFSPEDYKEKKLQESRQKQNQDLLKQIKIKRYAK